MSWKIKIFEEASLTVENKIESGFLNEIVYNFRSNLLILNSVQNRMVEVCAHVKLICQHVLKETFLPATIISLASIVQE